MPGRASNLGRITTSVKQKGSDRDGNADFAASKRAKIFATSRFCFPPKSDDILSRFRFPNHYMSRSPLVPRTAKPQSKVSRHRVRRPPGCRDGAEMGGRVEREDRSHPRRMVQVHPNGRTHDLAARRDWLKSKHKLRHEHRLVAGRARRLVDPPGTRARKPYLCHRADLRRRNVRWPRPRLRPLAEALMHFAKEVADDIKFCPCKTIIPFYREHVIAQIKPSTTTRIDFGLALRQGRARSPPASRTPAGSRRRTASRTRSRSRARGNRRPREEVVADGV